MTLTPDPPHDRPAPPGRQLRAGRWRRDNTRTRGAGDRVTRSHAQARRGLRLALVFIGAAVIAAVADGATWLAVHLLLAGGALLAISSVAPMLTVTWSAAPAPSDRFAVAHGSPSPSEPPASVRQAVRAPLRRRQGRRALPRRAGRARRTARHHRPARHRAALRSGGRGLHSAISFGIVGVALGIASAIGRLTVPRRSAHVTVNLLGFVGLVIAGTLPFFAATVGRVRIARHATPRRLHAATAWLAACVATAAAATLAGSYRLAGGAFVAYACGILAVLWLMPRLTRRQLRWAGPRIMALWIGSLWWCAAVVATAVRLIDGRAATFGRPWLLVLVVSGYAQIL